MYNRRYLQNGWMTGVGDGFIYWYIIIPRVWGGWGGGGEHHSRKAAKCKPHSCCVAPECPAVLCRFSLVYPSGAKHRRVLCRFTCSLASRNSTLYGDVRIYCLLYRGFQKVVGGRALSLFRPSELELLICGNPRLDFDALERNSKYEDGLKRDDQIVRNFWEVCRNRFRKSLPWPLNAIFDPNLCQENGDEQSFFFCFHFICRVKRKKGCFKQNIAPLYTWGCTKYK